MLKLKAERGWDKTKDFLLKCANSKEESKSILNKYGAKGVEILSNNTPIDSGLTSKSWNYEIRETKNGFTIGWYNTNVVDGVNVAVVLLHGHASRNGTWVEGTNYITQEVMDLFDEMTDAMWEELNK